MIMGQRMEWLRRVAGAVAVLCLGVNVPARAGSDKDDVDEIGNRNVAHKSIISTDKEIAIGRQYAEQIDKTAKLVKDPVVTEYVNRIAQNVARNSDLKVPLTVKVIDAPDINAFALPGGFLYVNSGLIKAADNESELAGVMAHEIAHVAARHWASQMTKATLLQYATIPLIFVPMSYPVYVGVSSALSYGVPLTFLKFSRADEAEADYLGLQYMYKAGYDPNAFAAFFGKVLEEERRQPGSVNQLFADHPPTPDRIIKAEEEIQKLPPREQYLLSTSEFDDVRGRVNTVLASMRKNQKPGPGLEKQKQPDQTSTQAPPDDQGADKPPVLQRKD
jgi:beta-barrel assembly-enhancing protease